MVCEEAQREARVHGCSQPRLVDEDDERRGGRQLAGGSDHRCGSAGHGAACHCEGRSARDASVGQRHAQGERSGQLQLDRRDPTGDRTEEGTQAHERSAVDGGVVERLVGVDGTLVDQQRPVGEDVDAGDPPRRLRDHPLDRLTLRQ